MTGPEARPLQPSASGVREQSRWVGPAPSPDLGDLFPAVSLLSSGPHEGLAPAFPPGVSGLNFAPLPALPQGYLTFLDSTVLWDPKECQMPIR